MPDEGVEEEHGDPRGDDERGGQAIQPPPPPVSGGLRPRAPLLRRRRPPQKGSPRPLHSFLPFPLPASPHIRARPRVRGEGIRPAQRSGIRAAAPGARRRGAGTGARGAGRGEGGFETAGGAPSGGEEEGGAFVLLSAISCRLRLPVRTV